MEIPKDFRFGNIDIGPSDFGSRIDLSRYFHFEPQRRPLAESFMRYIHARERGLDRSVQHAGMLRDVQQDAEELGALSDKNAVKAAAMIASQLSEDELGVVAQTAKRTVLRANATNQPVLFQAGDIVLELHPTEDDGVAKKRAYTQALLLGLDAVSGEQAPWDRWPDGSSVSAINPGTKDDTKTIVVLAALFAFTLAVPSRKQLEELMSEGQKAINAFYLAASGGRRGMPRSDQSFPTGTASPRR